MKVVGNQKIVFHWCGKVMWEHSINFIFQKVWGFNMSLWWFGFDFWCKNKFWWPFNPCVFFHGDLSINPTFVSIKHKVPMLNPLDFITNNYITIIWILEKILLYTLCSHSISHCITNMVQMIIQHLSFLMYPW